MTTSRRKFLLSASMLAAGTMVPLPSWGFGLGNKKLKVALAGTGIRGTGFWGKRLVDDYGELIDYVGLFDHNLGRLQYARQFMGVPQTPIYTDFDKMVHEAKPDLVIVCTKDATHHQFIVRGLELGCDVLTEKPLTTDEFKCQEIIDAEKKSNKKLLVGFNYRWSPYMTKIKQLLTENTIGKVTSVDFHWYLNTYHGASYFRRWHGERSSSGSLLIHKSTHHFDLVNWWLASMPEEVFAYGALEHYGANGPFRGDNCRTCAHQKSCDFYWDITKDKHLTKLYTDNEKFDGYVRDNCLFRKEVDIYDKMSVQIKYQNETIVNYSLTTYSPFEGWRIAFNGTKGRIEAGLGIPYDQENKISQEELHKIEMLQTNSKEMDYEPIIVHPLWKGHQKEIVGMEKSGHGGGDIRLHNHLFSDQKNPDPYNHQAGVRDGALSALIGIAANKSIESGQKIKVSELVKL